MKDAPRQTVSVDKELLAQLQDIARKEGCTVSWLMCRFSKRGVAAYEAEGHL